MLAAAFALVLLTIPTPRLQQTPGKTHTISGTCAGADAGKGSPARVSLWWHDYRKETAELLRDVRARPDGSFTFPDVPWPTDFDWGFGFFAVHATQGDRVGFAQLRGVTPANATCNLGLLQADALTGRVLAGDGKPVAGAEVRVLAVGDAFFAETPPPWVTRSAADGSFAIRGIAPGWKCAVTVLADRFARARIDAGADAEFVFTLAPGATLAGKVVDRSGKPQVRMRVCAQGVRKSAWVTARTDDQGGYALPGLPDDLYNVWADADELTCIALDSQAVVLGETTKCPDLVVLAGGFFVGTVLDAATGKPVQPGKAADVAIYGPSRPRSGAGCHISPIAPDGTFRIRVAPGSNYVYLRAGEGFEAAEPASFTLDVADGEQRRIEFKVRSKAAR